MWIIVLLLAIFAILYSIRNLWKTSGTNSFFSLSNLVLLSLVYLTVLIAFGLGYFVLEEIGFLVLKEHGNAITVNPRETVGTTMYFSAITLFSVGYGDITPIGFGRFIAVIEALIGYTLPFAFVARIVTEHDKRD
ncbi:ion channel [Ectobacillus sp. sgz5001026]|uniref:ion channel n=1 Tax=Ectobacillus sp. sgz5001026 TaxID=3242473 RepID=UPI0036D40195